MCKDNEHDLQVITRIHPSWDDSEKVVRWCAQCGAIVGDLEIDNRTRPGAWGKMRFPASALEGI